MVIAEGASNRVRPEATREVRPTSPIRKENTTTSKPDTSTELMQQTALDDDEASETGSQTDDDPLREIFDLVLGDEEDDEEKEEIVWNPRSAFVLSHAVQYTNIVFQSYDVTANFP